MTVWLSATCASIPSTQAVPFLSSCAVFVCSRWCQADASFRMTSGGPNFAGHLSAGDMVVAVSNAPVELSNPGGQASRHPLLRVTDLKISIPANAQGEVHPVAGVSFELSKGETVGLLGESGAGKTTLARSLLRLLPRPSRVEGVIEFDGVPLLSLGEKQLRSFRGDRISLVHQDSSVLNPLRCVGDQLVDVLRAHRSWSRRKCREEALSLLQRMDLEPVTRIYRAFPHQLSGGQRQRIVVAQALICGPALVIADEPTASVDSETALQILSLLKQNREVSGGAMMVISHDVAVLAEFADTIMVMRSGVIVERGPAKQVFNQPEHTYTRALLSCSNLVALGQYRISGLRLPTIASTEN